MDKSKQTEEVRPAAVWKPLKWQIPEDMPVLWANNFVAQHTEHEFILTFFQVTPPMLVRPTPEEIEAVKSVPARAVARIALTPSAMSGLLGMITENYETFQKKKMASEE